MAIAQSTEEENCSDDAPPQVDETLNGECKELLLTLPRARGWRTPRIFLFQGFWCQPKEIQAIISFQRHYVPRDSDVILSTLPKAGTTWLKALTFAVVNRGRYAHHYHDHEHQHPLLVSNPHDLVPFFEYKAYAGSDGAPDPRLFGTHMPYHVLEAPTAGRCKIIYICRNPFDMFVSQWIYLNKVKPEWLPEVPLDEAFEMFRSGAVGFGPFWSHVLGYWKASRERPDKVLFMKYEEMKEDIVSQLKRLASFLGYPFTAEEEEGGVVEGLAELCSFEKMKELEVNKSGRSIMDFENKNLFRKAEVGDWVNYLSPAMEQQLSKVLEEKLGGSGLEFKISPGLPWANNII
ncbi:hypothetical protein SAY87_019255 [Trapa incisa]|uniref:Sulfotransferase n=1 Tax=Trapa incisa TaxID=236973 RepID=A0AAN7Q2J9_9MYRT|nr:hypothetical protein SAY87_019255 [Trapa incisa]